ncbi:MAG TPA: SPFH domain-containing protein [Saprospiraceae bacterium]|jgi:regulator of protease activity HflC (stomatin/prohibitin superfamily)|nr:SPFH domain-containing protein [Saprospiraceae bacterium]MCC6688783.1 SPFH domain-containing protein [Saprospiraceae bacterium]HMV25124.1 SPFH domain-containing protein [Saprospiraceae bacterium]HMX84230.1 SPFH domain-containing protein [Saprospiraceae bacterium]HMX85627.1 SPFH domain-containing protein [Saprospiraceae bacterium]
MNEKYFTPLSGYLMFFVMLIVIAFGIYAAVALENFVITALCGLLTFFMLNGFFLINPNNSRVLTLFGEYKGSAKQNGFFWVNPFMTKKVVSLRASNFESDRMKVNDKRGNPIEISVILVWRVADTFKAAFEVDDYVKFVKVQTDAAVRKLAHLYPYDNADDTNELTLRGGTEEINHSLEEEIRERLNISGIEVLEARIGYLAYASEIAGAMLKRQQAEAVVAARYKIVEGAVGMVEQALEEMSKRSIIDLDDDKKAAMVSNLMVVLCGDREANPVINTGTLNS